MEILSSESLSDYAILHEFPQLGHGEPSIIDGKFALYDNQTKLVISAGAVRDIFMEIMMEKDRLKASRILLLLNQGDSRSFSLRKRALISHLLDPLKELQFVRLLTSWKPTNQTWHHRWWIISKYFRRNNGVISEEIDSVNMFLQRHPRDYHAWRFRSSLLVDFVDSVALFDSEIGSVMVGALADPLNRSLTSYLETLLKQTMSLSKCKEALCNARLNLKLFPNSFALLYHIKTLETLITTITI